MRASGGSRGSASGDAAQVTPSRNQQGVQKALRKRVGGLFGRAASLSMT
jgi:hypothetical protein